MTGPGFFVRSRGKISGPFDVEALRRLIRQGTLSRIHEISADRVTWASAADYEELFPARSSVVAAAPSEAAQQPPPAPPEPPAADGDPFAFVGPTSRVGSTVEAGGDGSAAKGLRYYYSQNGAAVGPISMAVLKLLAQNRTLAGTDLVWRENAETGVRAEQMPALAPLFSTGFAPSYPPTPSSAGLPALTDGQARTRQWAVQRFGSVAGAVGIIAGALVLLLLLLPWFSEGSQSFWWWDLYRVPGAGAWAAFCTYLTMAGVALCVLSPLTRGVARGITFVSVSAVAFFFLIGALLSNETAGGPALTVLVPVALAALLGVCSFRAAAPESVAGRVMLGICGGVITLGMLSSGILWASQNASFAGAPGAVVFGAVLAVVGAIAGLAAGVTAFVGLKPHFTPELNRATWACALVGLALPGLGVFIACLGAVNAFAGFLPSSGRYGSVAADAKFLAVQALLRVLLVWGSVLTVFAVGLAELMLASSVGHSRQVGRR